MPLNSQSSIAFIVGAQHENVLGGDIECFGFYIRAFRCLGFSAYIFDMVEFFLDGTTTGTEFTRSAKEIEQGLVCKPQSEYQETMRAHELHILFSRTGRLFLGYPAAQSAFAIILSYRAIVVGQRSYEGN